jgi:hypothetical protein
MKQKFATSNNAGYAGDPRRVYAWKLYGAFKWNGSLLLVTVRRRFSAWRVFPACTAEFLFTVKWRHTRKGYRISDGCRRDYSAFPSQSNSKLYRPRGRSTFPFNLNIVYIAPINSCCRVQRINMLPSMWLQWRESKFSFIVYVGTKCGETFSSARFISLDEPKVSLGRETKSKSSYQSVSSLWRTVEWQLSC